MLEDAMRNQISALLVIVVVLMSAGVLLPPRVPAQAPKSNLTIVKVSVPELDLYDDKGKVMEKKLQTSSLTLPLPVLSEETSKGLLKIRLVDGSLVWIRKSQVILRSSEDVPPCDPGRKMVAGAT